MTENILRDIAALDFYYRTYETDLGFMQLDQDSDKWKKARKETKNMITGSRISDIFGMGYNAWKNFKCSYEPIFSEYTQNLIENGKANEDIAVKKALRLAAQNGYRGVYWRPGIIVRNVGKWKIGSSTDRILTLRKNGKFHYINMEVKCPNPLFKTIPSVETISENWVIQIVFEMWTMAAKKTWLVVYKHEHVYVFKIPFTTEAQSLVNFVLFLLPDAMGYFCGSQPNPRNNPFKNLASEIKTLVQSIKSVTTLKWTTNQSLTESQKLGV